jgi:hypothetical protein
MISIGVPGSKRWVGGVVSGDYAQHRTAPKVRRTFQVPDEYEDNKNTNVEVG